MAVKNFVFRENWIGSRAIPYKKVKIRVFLFF